VLYALGRLQADGDRMITFNKIEAPLTRLLEEFGPPRKLPHPEAPFYYLQSDGVWEIVEKTPLVRSKGSSSTMLSKMRKHRTEGGFKKDIHADLARRPELVREIAREMLRAHFPESLHNNIASAVGLELDGTSRRRERDVGFRSTVISAWGHQCAFCGFSVQIGNVDLGLEAAHIRWCQAGGPDSVNNGLAGCSIHHQAFDRGAITISDELTILVSSHLHGSGRLDDLFVSLHRSGLRSPNRRSALPKRDFLAWHRDQVFRGEARD